jgi:peroxiredoxin
MFQLHGMMSGVLTLIDSDGRAHEIPTWTGYVEAGALTAATGWKLRSSGLCKDDVCVPLFGRAVSSPADSGLIDLDAWAAALGMLVAHDDEHDVSALMPSAGWRRMTAMSGKAPALDLADVDGNPVAFGDLSGSKRVLVTWASWCGCRHELGGWQALHDELADAGVKVFSVALDADPEDARPWIEAASPSYPVAVDTAHLTAERFGITNVPSVVWVDEDDNIVKPPTIAPGDNQFLDFTQIDAEQHHDLLRAWVRDDVLPECAGPELPERTNDELLALAHRRIAGHHQRAGRADAAKEQLGIALYLAPWDWTVRRGGIAMTGGDPFLGEAFVSFWEEWDAAGRPGYTPTT